jgi:hypothetical protein
MTDAAPGCRYAAKPARAKDIKPDAKQKKRSPHYLIFSTAKTATHTTDKKENAGSIWSKSGTPGTSNGAGRIEKTEERQTVTEDQTMLYFTIALMLFTFYAVCRQAATNERR